MHAIPESSVSGTTSHATPVPHDSDTKGHVKIKSNRCSNLPVRNTGKFSFRVTYRADLSVNILHTKDVVVDDVILTVHFRLESIVSCVTLVIMYVFLSLRMKVKMPVDHVFKSYL